MEGKDDSKSDATVGEENRGDSPATIGTENLANDGIDESKEYTLKDGQIEVRFKIDRRKLEKLIQAGEHGGENATKYFDRVMSETGAIVLWPSKLKIGAKSKKDPHVKVIGYPTCVEKAKELIIKDLDTKSNKFTLKLEVAHTEHSHIIGKGGANVKKVMQDTKCHIHFPDSNKEKGGFYFDKSNQVSISGLLSGVESARQKIRDLSPIFVWVDLPIEATINDADYRPAIEEIMTTFSVFVQIIRSPHCYNIQLMIRGTQMSFDGLKLAVTKLVELFVGEVYAVLPVTLGVDVSPALHQRLIGKGGGNIKSIMYDTNTSIQFPDSRTSRKNTVMLHGTMDEVFAARQKLIGCLPLVLMFDVQDEHNKLATFESVISRLMQELDVYISLKSKPKQSCVSVIVKSIEQNANCMYQTYDRLLEELDKDGMARSSLDDSCSMSWRFSSSNSSTYFGESLHGSMASRSQRMSARVLQSATSNDPADLEFSASRKQSDPMKQSSMMKSSTTDMYNPYASYIQKKERASRAMHQKVTFAEERTPQNAYCGYLFSESMPGSMITAEANRSLDRSDDPKGLSNLQKSGFQALMKSKQMGSLDQSLKRPSGDMYAQVTDLSSLLSALNLEKYEEMFHQEEIDLDVLLTMGENELEGIGISTLGARRKLSNAIKELNIRKDGEKPSGSGMMSVLLPSKMMSHSGRF